VSLANSHGFRKTTLCQVDALYKRQMKYHIQLLAEKSLFSSMLGTFHSFKCQKMAPSSLLPQFLDQRVEEQAGGCSRGFTVHLAAARWGLAALGSIRCLTGLSKVSVLWVSIFGCNV
jgi:hypothetical protein